MLSKKAKTINIKSEYKGKTVIAKNVIGKIPGKNNKKAVVLSAHFDHVGWAGETVFYGAVDNASGTTVLLDLAERLKEQSDNAPFDMDILICAFNGEEFGLLGSMEFVDDISQKYEDIYNINIDCVGSKTGGKIALDNEKENRTEDEPSGEAWGKAIKMAEQIKKDQDVQYDEAFYFKLDDYLFHSSGNKPLNSAKEVNNFYPDIKFPEKISKYEFKNIGIRQKGLDSTMGVGCIYESSFNGEIGKKYKREINPDNIWEIQIKYADEEYTVDITITNHSIIKTTNSFLVKTKLDEDKEGYYLIEEKETKNLRGFGIDYNSDGNSYGIQVERYKENVSVIMETSNGKYSNTEEDIINLIEELDLEKNIKKFINDLGM